MMGETDDRLTFGQGFLTGALAMLAILSVLIIVWVTAQN